MILKSEHGREFSFLDRLTDKIHKELDNELTWPQSMSGQMPEDDLIPIARYGDTNDGKIRD